MTLQNLYATQQYEVERERPWKVLAHSTEVEQHILSRYDAFIFDMDGVLWTVETPFPGAAETLQYLRDKGKHIFFATNNSMMRASQYAEKIARLGLGDFSSENVFCSSHAVALYLKQRNYQGKVYLIGPSSLKEELELVDGLEVIDSNDEGQRFIMPADMARVEVDTSIGAVAMGFDPHFNYYKLSYATAILHGNPNAFLVCTNTDRTFPTQNLILPGTGAFVAALETASGRKSIAAGKPSDVIINEILRRFPAMTPHRICMVGDNLRTDIAFGRLNGLGTVLVETGVNQRKDLHIPEYAATLPDFVLPSVARLAPHGDGNTVVALGVPRTPYEGLIVSSLLVQFLSPVGVREC